MDGLWVTFSENGEKTAEARYQKNQKHGKWYIWDQSGVLRYDMTYTKGEKTGVWIIYDEDGNKISEKKFK